MAQALVACAVAVSMAFCVGVALAPAGAQALTTNKATARPNEQGGDGVIGGENTRLTWEGTVDAGEQVESITLSLPEGASFDGSTTRITVLEGLNRVSVDGTATPAGDTLKVSFATPIPEGSLLRLEVTDMKFPEAGGDYAVGGSYVNQAGQTEALNDSPTVSVIANTPLQRVVTWLDGQAWVSAWNSNAFLGMFLKPQLIVTSLATLFPGWLLCLLIVIVAYPFAIALGLAFAFMKMSRHKPVRAIAIVYINVLRGTPLFLQIYIAFFGLPMLGVNINNTILGIVVMAINSSAYLAEIFRAGIESIPVGQYEAAASLGMNRSQTMVSIILPQTVRRVIPTVTSDFIMSYKDTSLLSSVGVMELMMFAKNLTTVSGNITPYMAAAIFYLIVTLPLSKVVGNIEKRLAHAEKGTGPRPKTTGEATENA
ncbi:MAG: amino acid ABC transporter permease [Atopobiaceae bacterium]|jgi:polar amino acid transport system substrate-binding protein|nr:amino acid ABC transporter permease [Atopobiaceae bacterium]